MPTRNTYRACFFGVILCVVGCTQHQVESPSGAYQATGFKIGELTHHSAIIWTRLTLKPERVGTEAPMPTFMYRAPNMAELQETPPGRFHPHDWVPIVRYEKGFFYQQYRSVQLLVHRAGGTGSLSAHQIR